jgi:hydroxyacylglutathione hydrolase
VPSVLALERATNPFLRVDEPAVIAAAERWAGRSLPRGAEVFRALRTWKDRDYD